MIALLYHQAIASNYDSIICRLQTDNKYLSLKGSILYYNNKEYKNFNDSTILIFNPTNIIKLEINNSYYSFRFDTLVFTENLNANEFVWTLNDAQCQDLSEKHFYENIKLEKYDLYIQCGDPPITYYVDKLLWEKYKIIVHVFGCISGYSQVCMENYNKRMAKHLDKIYKKKWRKYLRKDLEI